MVCKVAREERIIDCLELQRGQENLHKNEKKYVNKEICNVGCKRMNHNGWTRCKHGFIGQKWHSL